MVRLHQPRLILITPPPVNEYQFDTSDAIRTAENTRKYADACCDVGEDLGIVVLDLWSAMMKEAGWRNGEKLIGSKDAPCSPVFEKMFTDGEAYMICV